RRLGLRLQRQPKIEDADEHHHITKGFCTFFDEPLYETFIILPEKILHQRAVTDQLRIWDGDHETSPQCSEREVPCENAQLIHECRPGFPGGDGGTEKQ